MAEIQKRPVNTLWNGIWVEVGEVEILTNDKDVVKVIGFTPKDLERVGSHVTRTNPSGSIWQCARRDIHGEHEWQAEFGSYFNTYCPGNDGSTP